MPEREVVLSQPVRTAIGTYNGTLRGIAATELGAAVVRETVRRSGIDPGRVGSVVMGNVIQAGNRMNPARQAAVNGGVPIAVPALTTRHGGGGMVLPAMMRLRAATRRAHRSIMPNAYAWNGRRAPW